VRKKLTRQGNAAALVIDRPLLELLGLEPGSTVEILTDGSSLLIRPVRPPEPERQKA
jgi:antitoxin MazE